MSKINAETPNKISIIIPHYNSPKTLEVLLKSVFEEKTLLSRVNEQNGELADFVQVIVVDDNSTAEVELYNQIKAKFEAAYPEAVLFLRNTTGKNASGTCRNFGLEAACGQWLLFADSDDYFAPGWYEIVSDHFDGKYNLVLFGFDSFDASTGELSSRATQLYKKLKNYGQPDGPTDLDIKYCIRPPWAKLIRKSVVDENNIKFPPFLWADDAFFSAYVAYYANEFDIDRRVLYMVADSPGNVTKNYSQEATASRFICAAMIHRFLRKVVKLNPEDLNRCSYLTYWTRKYINFDFGFDVFKMGRIVGLEWFYFCLSSCGRNIMQGRLRRNKKIAKAVAKGTPIYVYGAGNIARRHLPALLAWVDKRGRKACVKAVVVTNTEGNPDQLEGIPIVALDEAAASMKKALVIVAVHNNREQIVEALKERGITNFVCY